MVVTDRGSQFLSSAWAELSQRLGFTRRTTTAYHPCSNGLVERVHRTLKTALCSADPVHWVDSLPMVLLGLRSALKVDLGCSSAELVYGTTLRLPGDFVDRSAPAPPLDPGTYVERLRRAMRRLHHVSPRSPYRPVYVPRELCDASHVYIRRDGYKPPLVPPYDGPFAVARRTDKTVTVLRNDREDAIAIDRVKPALVESPVTPVPASRPSPQTSAGHSGPELILRSEAPPPPQSEAPEPVLTPPAASCARDREQYGSGAHVCSASPTRPIIRTRLGRVIQPPARYREDALRVTFQEPT